MNQTFLKEICKTFILLAERKTFSSQIFWDNNGCKAGSTCECEQFFFLQTAIRRKADID
jgi:hypothetical protein